MKVKTTEQILKKVEEWRQSPLLTTGIYTLFTYIPFKSIPDEYKDFFEKEAADIWDTQLDLTGKEFEVVYSQLVRGVLGQLKNLNIVAAFGFIPMLLADAWVHGVKIGNLEQQLIVAVEKYQEEVAVERPITEMNAIITITEFILELLDKLKIDLKLQGKDGEHITVEDYVTTLIAEQFAFTETGLILYRETYNQLQEIEGMQAQNKKEREEDKDE